MSAIIFADTNVLVYALDAAQGDKQRRAHEWLRRLWRTRSGRVSVQVLQECYITLTRKLKPGLPPADARREVERYFAWSPTVLTPELLERAWIMEATHSLSWWDALIVAAAQSCGARYLLTEDLQDGQELLGVLVVNPFRHTPDLLDHA